MHYTYELGGVRIRVGFSDPRVGLVCQGFFHLSRISGVCDHEILFKEVDAKLLESGSSEEALRSAGVQDEMGMRIVLEEGIHLFFSPMRKRMLCFYPEGIFEESDRGSGGYTLVYENTFNDETLPPKSSGVINSVYLLLECLGIFRLHASYVGYGGKEVIFVGAGGVGKTTSALNVFMNGGTFYCDDQVFFKKGRDGKVEVYPLVKKTAVTEDTIDYFPNLLAFKDMRFKRFHKYNLPLEATGQAVEKQYRAPDLIIFPFIMNEEGFPAAEEMSSYAGFLSFMKGEILYPPVSSGNRGIQLDLVERLTGQARIFSFFQGSDMADNFKLFKNAVLLECAPKERVL
jgi:hypothetical protein